MSLATTKLATRVADLLRVLLISDNAGETAAAVHALRRTIAANGLDVHQFVAALVGNFDGAGIGWKLVAEFCHRHRDRLTGKEAEFVASLLSWRSPTVKQRQWLLDIHERLRLEQSAQNAA